MGDSITTVARPSTVPQTLSLELLFMSVDDETRAIENDNKNQPVRSGLDRFSPILVAVVIMAAVFLILLWVANLSSNSGL